MKNRDDTQKGYVMREIVISTESGSDMPKELTEKYGVYVLPLHVTIDSTPYEDGSIPIDRIYDYYNETKKIPTTSAANVAEYTDFFQRIQTEHPGCVIMHFAYSSLASCTYQNAEIAIRDFEDIYLIDTKNVSGGCTAHIAHCYKLIQERKDSVTDYAALAAELQAEADKVQCFFVPGNLDYLKAGGRVSNAQYLGATLLRLKPLIEMKQGQLIATKKYRGSIEKNVDAYMQDYLDKHDIDRSCLYLMYSKGLSQAALDRMKENAIRFGFKEYEYVMTGCVISCHCGPGAIGIAGIER